MEALYRTALLSSTHSLGDGVGGVRDGDSQGERGAAL